MTKKRAQKKRLQAVSWWQTMPALLTGLGGLTAATAALITILYQIGFFSHQAPSAVAQSNAESDVSIRELFDKFKLFGTWAVDCGKPNSEDNGYAKIIRPASGPLVRIEELGRDWLPNRYAILTAKQISDDMLSVRTVLHPGTKDQEINELVWLISDDTLRTLSNRPEGAPGRVRGGVGAPMTEQDAAYSTHLTPVPGALLVFIDDTGHETFAGNQGYYGLGGCAVPLEYYEEVKFHWRRVRASVSGHADRPLHASALPRNAQAIAAVSVFFKLTRFFRFGAISTHKVPIPAEMHSAKPVMEMIKKHVAAIMGRSRCSSVALIFEQSHRADPVLLEQFGVLDLEEDGRAVEVDHLIMPKSANEIGLEIADFVANACGSQARRVLAGSDGFAQDYQSIFHSVPSAYSRFMQVEAVTGTYPDEMASGFEIR